ncbi:hypothetical protein [Peristeroidobacter soli]|uniref:hypothetical protein n=1 Tax=Peristeroidobacter soli TaxID=2497877 RepID=UPI00101D9ED0|nr:hypothetical protein [Peristeroidobacter soli]
MSIQIVSILGQSPLMPASFRPASSIGVNPLTAMASPSEVTTQAILPVRAPAPRIWPHILHSSAWRDDPMLKPLPPLNQRARFKAVHREAPDDVLYYLDIVEILEEQRKIARLSAPDRSPLGYESWVLTPQDDVTMLEYCVCGSPAIAEHRSRYRIVRELETLKRIVEGAATGLWQPPSPAS